MRLAAALIAVMAGPVAAHPGGFTAGTKLSCPAAAGGPVVHVWIGIVERWSDYGIDTDPGHDGIYHAQVATSGADSADVAEHMPFGSDAFISCRGIDALGFDADTAALRQGYLAWRGRVERGEPRSFDMSPSTAYANLLTFREAR